ncbi:aminotransferase class III-fold pyridoxal phosphate-dependent enzyme [Streptomyces canus]|uniref:aminotransferase class III-fold pyridoxal phosphate-dependent enzyme n=1 Tax=Streptomyces canus TaxID=58343 RepID=UPI0037135CFC
MDASIRSSPNLLDRADPAAEGLPLFAERAAGAHIWDSDGRRYLDFILGFGSVILGHAEKAVDDAVVRQLHAGVSPSLRSPRQVELAELLTRHVPGAQRALLLRTGSDATEAAVRIARAYTGRRHVLHWGYHGWHDWCAPRAPGVPDEYRSYTSAFAYNDLDSLSELFARHRGDVAGVIMMPLELEEPRDDFLRRCAELAHRHGALFMLDEVRTGFRLALGGAQQYYGVEADLTALSKAMGNGYPIAAVTGPAEIMSAAERTSHSSVFFRSTDGSVAAIATITALADRGVSKVLWERGEQFTAGLRDAIGATGVPARVVGLPVMPYHAFDLPPGPAAQAHRMFCRTAAAEGVLFHPAHHWFVCAAMTPADIACAVEAAAAGYRAVQQLVTS